MNQGSDNAASQESGTSGIDNMSMPNATFCCDVEYSLTDFLSHEYVELGHAIIIDKWLYLPNGQPVPNNGSGCGIKAGIDA
jgi:hypothetical protein